MVAWLVAEGVTHVTMEATGIYWKPIFHALCAAERALEVLLVNARHVKNVPGRKSDVLDAVWLAELTECGLLRASFIPPREIAAIRDLTECWVTDPCVQNVPGHHSYVSDPNPRVAGRHAPADDDRCPPDLG